MSGKAQFDEAAVLGAAMEVFWQHGYAATSISELTDATGLSRSSLYQRFGDKDGLFREALQAYAQRVLQRMGAARAETPRARLEALLRGFLPDPARPAGCLIGWGCVEIARLTVAGQTAIRDAVERQRHVFKCLLQEGVKRGELSPDADIEALAWHFLGVLQAIVTLSQVGADRNALSGMIRVALSAWPDATATPGGAELIQ